MATVRQLLPGKPRARPARNHLAGGAGQALLDVPASYGGHGSWIDRRSWPQLGRLLERCREDLALYQGMNPGEPGLVAARLRVAAGAGRRAGRRRCFLAGLFDDCGEMCAAVEVSRHEPDDGEWWLGLLLVRPDLRGRGIGACVVEALEGWVRAEGGRAIHVAVQLRNAAALHFARRTGFVPRGERLTDTAAGASTVALLVREVA